MRGRALATIGVLGSALLACQVLLGVTDDEGTPRPEGSAGSPSDPCTHAVPPAAPADASDGVDLPPTWFAFTSLEGLPRSDGRPVGFDLDGRCTGFGPGTAFDGGGSCARQVVDQLGGVDNAAQAMFASLPGALGKAAFDSFEAAARAGAKTVLLYLSRYNGKPDDPSVSVKLVVSEPMQTAMCDGGVASEAGAQLAGCDTWGYANGSLTTIDGGAVPSAPYEGFVSEGRLVVTGFDVDLGTPALAIPIVGAVLVARFGDRPTPGGGAVRTLTGTLAGRIAPTALLAAAARVPSSCTAPGLEALRKSICDFRDMPQSLSDDPSRPCTHVSVGLGFQAVQGKLGAQVTAPAAPPPCAVPIPTCE